MRLADQSLRAMLLGGWRSSSWCLPSARRGLHRRITQQNAALVEEGAAAAISLRDQAALVESVAAFRLRAAGRKAA